MSTVLQLTGGVRTTLKTPADAKYFNTSDQPYTSTSQVLSQLPDGIRHPGLIVNVDGVEYWWPADGGTTDGELVVYTMGGGGSLTDGKGTTANGTAVDLGGTVGIGEEVEIFLNTGASFLIGKTGIVFEITAAGDLNITGSGGTTAISLQSLYNILIDGGANTIIDGTNVTIQGDNLLLTTIAQDDTKNRVLVIDNTGETSWRDPDSIGRKTFIDLDDTDNVNYTGHKGGFPVVTTEETGLRIARKQQANFTGDGSTEEFEILGFLVYDVLMVFVGGVFQHSFDQETDFDFGTNTATITGVGNDVDVSIIFLGVVDGESDTLPTPTLNADPVSISQINLSWNNVSSGANYILQVDDNPSFTSPTNIYTGTGLSFDHTGITKNTLYYYRIKAQKSGFTDSAYGTKSATTLIGSIFLGEKFRMIGDSYGFGQGSTPGNSTYDLMVDYLEAQDPVNDSLGGSGVYRMAAQAGAELDENTFGMIMTMVPGFNDRRRSGANAKTTEKIRGAYRFTLMNALAKKFYPASAFTQTGSWSNIGGGTFGNKFASPNNAGAATLEATISGKNFGVAFLGSSGDVYTFGTLQILVDGVEKFNSSMNNKADGISDGVYDNSVTPYGVFILGLSDGPHDFEFISTDSTPIDFIVELVDYPNEYSNTVIVVTDPLMPDDGYAVSPANATESLIMADIALVKSVVNELGGNWPVSAIDIQDLNKLTDFDPDNVHLNDSGYLKVTNKAKAAFSLNNTARIFNELVDMIFYDNYYQSRNPSTWQAYGLSGLYLPAATNGYIQCDVDDGDFGMFGLNTSDTLETYTGYEYGASLYEGSIRQLTSGGASFSVVTAGPLNSNGRIRFGRFGGNIKIQYASDGSTYTDVKDWGSDATAFYLNIAMYEGKKVFNVITNGFVTKP